MLLLKINALHSSHWIKVRKQYQLGRLHENLCLLFELFSRLLLVLFNLLQHSAFNVVNLIKIIV